MKFGQLILRRIVKIVATNYQILRLKCTKIPRWEAHSALPVGESAVVLHFQVLHFPVLHFQRPLPDPLAGFKGPTSKGRGYRKGGKGRGGQKRRGRGRQREGKKGRGG